MNGWYRYLVTAAAALILAGCVGRQTPAPVNEANQGQPPAPVETPQPPSPLQPPPITAPETVPGMPNQPGPIENQTQSDTQTQKPAPKERHYSWSSAAVPLINQMVKAKGVNGTGILLVDSVNNRTNGSIQTDLATDALHSALSGSKFTLVGAQQLAQAKRQLGLSAQDSLGTLSKALGLARSVGAQYVLYSNATGSAAAPVLKLQLMLVQTGEIIWSGSGAVQ